VCFVTILALAFKVGYLQYPFDQFSEPDAVNFPFAKVISKPLIQAHGNILMVGPGNGQIVNIAKRHAVGCVKCVCKKREYLPVASVQMFGN
jgi:hypothetical protein